MSNTAFTRQLGSEVGVQLNPTQDRSERFATDATREQSFAAICRLKRGQIGQPILVHKGNMDKVIGSPEPIRLNPLNIAQRNLREALSKGAKAAVVWRLVGEQASVKWILARSRYDAEAKNVIQYTMQDEAPTDADDFIFAIKHLGCFNDGIRVGLSVPAVSDVGGVNLPTSVVNINIYDNRKNLLHTIHGSLDLNSVDEDGLPNHIAAFAENYLPDDVELLLTTTSEIMPQNNAYGKNKLGQQNEVLSDVLYAFDEGGTGYTMAQYDEAVFGLTNSPYRYTYVSSLMSESVALVYKLNQLVYDTNTTGAIDVPPTFTPEQAAIWVNQLNLDQKLLTAIWHPVKALDETGINGLGYYGAGHLRIAYACARNAMVNGYGLPKKQQPIAGRDYGVSRPRMKQTYMPKPEELSLLADTGITPCVYESYIGGGRYAFLDVCTLSKKRNSHFNLSSAVEIITSIENMASEITKSFVVLKGMDEGIKAGTQQVELMLKACYGSKWLLPVEELGGAPYQVQIVKSEMRPTDTLLVYITCRPEGVARQVHITVTVTL